MRSYRPGSVLVCTIAALLAGEFGVTTANSAEDPLKVSMARMDQAAAGFKGLTADVTKLHHEAAINMDSTDTGKIVVKRSKPKDMRARMDIDEPDPSSAVFEGHKVQIYHPRTGELQPIDLGKQSTVVDQFLLLGFGSNSRDLASAYTITLGGQETVGGEKTTRLDLIPKDQDVLAKLKKVELWISDTKGISVQQKFYEPGADYNLVTYTNIQINPAIPDSVFELPKGTRPPKPPKSPGKK